MNIQKKCFYFNVTIPFETSQMQQNISNSVYVYITDICLCYKVTPTQQLFDNYYDSKKEKEVKC